MIKAKNIILLSNNSDCFVRYSRIKSKIQQNCNKIRVFHLTTHRDNSEQAEYVFGDVDHDIADLDSIVDTLRKKYKIEPIMMYGSDLGYSNKDMPEEEYLRRTYSAASFLYKYINKNNIGLIFMPGGGSFITNTIFSISELFDDVFCFRIHPLHYLNVDRSKLRYFFSDNNYHRIPSVPLFNNEGSKYEQAKIDAAAYINAVKGGHIRPDKDARKIAKVNMFTPDTLGLGKTVVNILVECIRSIVTKRQIRLYEINRFLSYFRKLYLIIARKSLRLGEKYFIFILHHPLDSQVRFRGRHFTDQIALCRIIASNLPYGTKLIVKEHPVYPGMMPIADVRRLLKLYKNIEYADYRVNFSDIVTKASAVITINSTSGLEAAILGVPVITLGEGFYRGTGFVKDVFYFGELTSILSSCLNDDNKPNIRDVNETLTKLLYYSEIAESDSDKDINDAIVRGIVERVELLSKSSINKNSALGQPVSSYR